MPKPTTNPIPAWSAQITYNGPQDERDLLVRLARESGARSLAQFLKHLVFTGVAAKSPEAAQELREIRRRYYGYAAESLNALARDGRAQAVALLLFIFSAAMFTSWFTHEDLLRGCRRCARRPGTRFEECVTVETV